MSVLTYFPKNRLTELVSRFGGLSRDDAVAAATRELESMRGEADANIVASIALLEKSAMALRKGEGPGMGALLEPCDQIVTLAGTYGYTALDKAARSLCDLLDGLMRAERNDPPSILVHVQTLRMLAPGGMNLAQEHTALMLAELAKVLEHHGFTALHDNVSPDSEDALIGKAV